MKTKVIALTLLSGLMSTSLIPAYAGSTGRRNTTIGLGAVTAYGLIKKKKTVAIVGALGTAYAYSRYSKSKKQEKQREARRAQWYKNRYGKNWRNHLVKGK